MNDLGQASEMNVAVAWAGLVHRIGPFLGGSGGRSSPIRAPAPRGQPVSHEAAAAEIVKSSALKFKVAHKTKPLRAFRL